MKTLRSLALAAGLIALFVSVVPLGAQTPSGPAADLKNPDIKRRERAAKELAKKGSPADVPALAEALKDSDAKVRREVVIALASIHAPESLDPLISATHDEDVDVRLTAVQGLTNYYVGDSASGGFIGFWQNTYRKAKGHYVKEDVKIDPGVQVDPKVISALVEMLNKADSLEPGRAAASGLGILRAKAAVPDLIKAANSPDEDLAVQAIYALSKVQDLSAGPQLVSLLDSSNKAVREETAETVGILRTKEAVPKLQSMYENSRDRSTQLKSLDGLAYIGSPASVPLFLKVLWDADKAFRARAAEGLARAHDEKGLPDLDKAVNAEKDAEPRYAMMFAITSLGKMDYLSDLVNGLSSTLRGDVVRSYLIELSRDPQMLTRLYPFLNSRDSNVRLRLCTVLMYNGDASSIPYLEQLSQDSKSEVATEALRALRAVRLRASPASAPTAPK